MPDAERHEKRAVLFPWIRIRPTISVLVPTYNRPHELALCLDGFAHQTVSKDEFEIVVVDDGSTEDLAPALSGPQHDLNLRLIRTSHAGPGAARNIALGRARADVLLLYDDDLRPTPDLIQYCLEFHREHRAEEDMALLRFGPDPTIAESPFEAWAFQMLYPFPRDAGVHGWARFWTGTLTVKKSLFRFGQFDPAYQMLEDAELGLRLTRNADIRVHFEPRLMGNFTRHVTIQQICSRQYTVGYYTYVFAQQYRGAVDFNYPPYNHPEKYVVRDPKKLEVLIASIHGLDRFGAARGGSESVRSSKVIHALWSTAETHARAEGWMAARDGRRAEPPGSLGPLLA